jgi:hypothetical protein
MFRRYETEQKKARSAYSAAAKPLYHRCTKTNIHQLSQAKPDENIQSAIQCPQITLGAAIRQRKRQKIAFAVLKTRATTTANTRTRTCKGT